MSQVALVNAAPRHLYHINPRRASSPSLLSHLSLRDHSRRSYHQARTTLQTSAFSLNIHRGTSTDDGVGATSRTSADGHSARKSIPLHSLYICVIPTALQRTISDEDATEKIQEEEEASFKKDQAEAGQGCRSFQGRVQSLGRRSGEGNRSPDQTSTAHGSIPIIQARY